MNRSAERAETVGDHIRRRRRLLLKLLQRKVADQLGVDNTSVFNWESNTSKPEIRYIPAIIGFLSYNPLPLANTFAKQLIHQRTIQGLSQKEAAGRLGVDPGTLAKWEREPQGVYLGRVKRFLFEDGTLATPPTASPGRPVSNDALGRQSPTRLSKGAASFGNKCGMAGSERGIVQRR